MASERTLINWLRTAATLGLGATAQGALWYFHADAAHDDEFGDEA